MGTQRPSQWPFLFDLAVEILHHCYKTNGFTPEWSFGGGTALMLSIDHRESHDIDIFLDDPQVLPFLNPEMQDYPLTQLPSGYVSDGTRALKLVYENVGEIDFICSAHILDDPYGSQNVRGHRVKLETPAEIIAKKIYFRGSYLQPRDMFDLAAVAEHFGHDYVVRALRECGGGPCQAALSVVEKAKPEFVQSIAGQLMYRERTRHLVTTAQETTRDILQLALQR